MKRTSISYCFVILQAASLVAVSAEAQQKPQAKPVLPPARMIPGITAPDANPHACVDCHTKVPEQNLDVRFSTLLAAWAENVEPLLLAKARASAPSGMVLQGRHPRLPGITNDVPANCLACHSRDSNAAPPFARLMHAIHLTKGSVTGDSENHFLTIFQGECTYCHKLDAATGQWTIPSGPEKK